MIDENYLPGVLTLGYSLRKYNVTKNLVCLVQDHPVTINNKKYNGVSKKAIQDILQVYDVVYGINLLYCKTYINKNHFTQIEHYKNIMLYVTKLQILGVTNYNKILYIDASSLVTRNLDYLFKCYNNKSAYRIDLKDDDKEYGLPANLLLIKTSLIQYNQGLYLLHNYNKIFGQHFFMRGVDETLIYFAIYPNWDFNNLLKRKMSCPSSKQHFHCPVYAFAIYKPWRHGVDNKKEYYKLYNQWDDLSYELLQKFPQFCHYYTHISAFRPFTLPSICPKYHSNA